MQDFSEIDDFLSKEEIKKYIDDFLVSHQSLNDESIIDAFDQLCELADRQCNTYTILEKEYQDKITRFIKKYIKFNDIEVMDAVLYIIPNLGLKDAFQFILKNRYKIKKREIIRLLDKCIKEYGETVENPYSDL